MGPLGHAAARSSCLRRGTRVAIRSACVCQHWLRCGRQHGGGYDRVALIPGGEGGGGGGGGGARGGGGRGGRGGGGGRQQKKYMGMEPKPDTTVQSHDRGFQSVWAK